MVGDFVKTASSRFQVTPNRARRGKGGQGCLFTKNLQQVPRYDHDIYKKCLSMYIPAIDHCHSALTNCMEWVEDDDNIVRNWKVVWQQ